MIMIDQDFTTINQDRFGCHLANNRFNWHINPFYFCFRQTLDGQLGEFFTFSNDGLVTNFDCCNRSRTNKLFRFKLDLDSLFAETIGTALIKTIQNILCGKAQCLQQNSGRHLATQINPEIHLILGIKFKIQP